MHKYTFLKSWNKRNYFHELFALLYFAGWVKSSNTSIFIFLGGTTSLYPVPLSHDFTDHNTTRTTTKLNSGNWSSLTRRKLMNLNIINLGANNYQAFPSCTFGADASLFQFCLSQFISLFWSFISFIWHIFSYPL